MSYVSLCDWSLSKLGKFASFQILRFSSTLSWEKKSLDSKLVKPWEFVKVSPGLRAQMFLGGLKFQQTLRTQIYSWNFGVKKQNEELNLGMRLLWKQVFFFFLFGWDRIIPRI